MNVLISYEDVLIGYIYYNHLFDNGINVKMPRGLL